MKCFFACVFLTVTGFIFATAAEIQIRDELQTVAEQITILRNQYQADMSQMKKEVEELKKAKHAHVTNNHARNEHATLQWAKRSMEEIRVEMRELQATVNNSVLLRQLHSIRNEIKAAALQYYEVTKLGRTLEIRVKKLEKDVSRVSHDGEQMRIMIAEQHTHLGKLTMEVHNKEVDDMNLGNDIVLEPEENRAGSLVPEHSHKYRHNKMVNAQITQLTRTQVELDDILQSLQTQIIDIQSRMVRVEEPNWNLLSAKMDFLELEHEVFNNFLKNYSQKESDITKVHASILELREDVESIENKADKTIPEFRKEISKLDVNFAQLNAASSYFKEDQENLRQSVKAIAVSVSNAIDRAEMDRIVIKKMNDTVGDLESRSRQHFYRLNDHILKSEANRELNQTETIPLPELMGEVKELQPVEREYEDLVNQLPRDCSSIYGPAGVYLIHPGHAPFETWCSNSSTLIQRRFNGSIEFNRKFSEYVHGFGDPSAEYWLGLESMHKITADNCSSMRIDMSDIYGGFWYAEYERFYVGSGDGGYVLEVDGFRGNASDAFDYQNHMEFSAVDRDRDISNTHCAGNYEGGWWYSHCQHVNINGKYALGLTWFDSVRNEWIAVATSEMRMSRRAGCF